MAIIGIFIIICFMGLMPPFSQGRIHEINTDLFKKIKINRFAFLFRVTGGEMFGEKNQQEFVKEYGLIKPMFFIQILGYLLVILSTMSTIILHFAFNIELKQIAIIMSIALGAEIFLDISIIIITVLESNRRERKLDNDQKKRL